LPEVRCTEEAQEGLPAWWSLVASRPFEASPTLSEREIEALSLIAAGNSNKLVADQLAISEDTVKGHVKSILSKLFVSDRTHAVTAALKRGIIEL
jgi:DNA-binding NarL/FixJ family response regulator